MIHSQDILNHLSRGVDYLLSLQHRDGSWRDYQLPVGESDQWVTAFTGLGIVRANQILKCNNVRLAAIRAVEFLVNNKKYDSGWGYNSNTGVDADSTSYALRLFRELEFPVALKDELCLLDHFNEDGGFRTYRENSGWGISHSDVTAVAAMALCDKEFLKIKSLLINYCNNCFFPEVGWPAYWWRNHLYSTWHMLELYERLELSIPKEIDKIAVTIDSIFDLSWSLGILHKLGNLNEVLEKPLLVLFNLQESSGKWPGGANLRVTDPECLKPWINPTGNYYIDINGTITTASALSVLSKF